MDIDQATADATMVDISQKPLSSPAECLARLLQTEEYADLTIVLPGTEKTLKVHRMVLAMWSPVFKAMLFGPMSEGDIIKLPEDHPEAFKCMLDYMYSGCTKLPSVDIAVHVSMLSNKYQMDHLKTTCSKYLMDSVTAASVPQVMNAATLLDNDALIKKCSQIIESSPDNVFLSPSVGSFSSKSLQQLLSTDMPVSSETSLFKGILTWGSAQLKLRNEDITSINIRKEVDIFLPQIRFLALTTNEFAKNVLPENILNLEESSSILQIIAGVQGVTIPKSCSNIDKPRRVFLTSELKSCRLYRGGEVRNDGKTNFSYGEERELMSAMKFKKTIFLSKLVYVSNIDDSGKLIVKDSSSHKIAYMEFNGLEAVFERPLKMIPGEEYIITMEGKARTNVDRYVDHINSNEIFSGHIMNNYIKEFTIHYWE